MTIPMRERGTVRDVRARVAVIVAAIVIATVALIAGRLPFSVFVIVVLLAAYYDVRHLLAEPGHPATFVLGGLGVAGMAWTGYTGDLDVLPAIVAAVILALLVTRIVLHEAGSPAEGVTGDLAATLGATGIVGVLGAHVLLTRTFPLAGFRGVLAFGAMTIACEAAASLAGRVRRDRSVNHQPLLARSWQAVGAGVAASVLVGLVCGLLLDPPFGVLSGVAFGAGVGVLVALGDLAFSAVRRSAGTKRSGTYLAGAGALDLVDGPLFAAPAFYWAFRTIAL